VSAGQARVTKLLQSPNSQVRILKDTTKADYAFTSNSQREQLKSTILMCQMLRRHVHWYVAAIKGTRSERAARTSSSFLNM